MCKDIIFKIIYFIVCECNINTLFSVYFSLLIEETYSKYLNLQDFKLKLA